VLLLLVISGLWYCAIFFYADKIAASDVLVFSENLFPAISSLFSALALATMVYLLVLLSLDVKANRLSTELTVQSHKRHLEIIALTALIQECDTTLYRYDRWEEAGIKGDYMNAKTSVREKMNAYREKLEQIYEEIG